MRAVFLDRDGVVNHDRLDYVKRPDEFCFLPGVLETLRRLAEERIPVFIISNQAGVGKGVMDLEQLEAVTRYMLDTVKASGGKINHVYYCVHHPDAGCNCRKPKPGLLIQACDDFGIALTQSVIVGDTWRDLKTAKEVGCRTVLVLSGKTAIAEIESWDLCPDHVAPDLSAAVDWLLRTGFACALHEDFALER